MKSGWLNTLVGYQIPGAPGGSPLRAVAIL
jgi:hypothetical protein